MDKIRKIKNFFLGKKGQSGMGSIAASNASGSRVDSGTVFIWVVFFIFLFDLWNVAGGRYAGFVWIWSIEDVSKLPNILTSSIFGTFLLIYAIVKIIKRQWNAWETISYAVFAFVLTFLLINNNWATNFKAWIHFGYILAFGFMFIKSTEDSSTAYWYMTVLPS